MTTGRATAGNAVERFVLAPAAADPVGTAVIDAPTGRTTTRAGLAEGVLRAAAALRGLGVQPEQRVLLVLADRPAFLHAFFGAMAIGAVPVPVSTMLTAKDYRFLLEDSRAVALLVSDLFTAEVLPAAAGQPFLGQVLVEGGGDDRFTAACTATTPLRAEDVFPATEDDAAFWLYTSGTTGFPKAAVHRHIDLGFLTDAYARGVLAMGPADRVYSVPKLFFAYGLGNAYFALG
ncbi:MAG: AMP-binding protein, partial [Acidimicrobiia bacterium]|nr:AMP-binding protein [Acidimicrobiia bacterium]